MAFKDILIYLTSYPAATAAQSIETAVGVAAKMAEQVSALAVEIDIRSPVGLYVDVLNVRGILAAERKKSATNVRDVMAAFEAAAARHNVAHDHYVEISAPAEILVHLLNYARLRDITMLPMKKDDPFQQRIAEHLVFESGRPLLILPEGGERRPSTSFEKVAVAWDGTRAATRAIADARPVLRQAKEVRIFTVVGDKAIPNQGSGSELAKHLSRHGVKATVDELKSNGRSIGESFEAYVRDKAIDLLVMGAYGHSRMREFFLGSATKSMLERPPSWLFLSH